MIDQLREPKIQLLGTDVAVFDLSLTVLATYHLAKRFGVEHPLIWSPVLGVAGGYAVHKLLGVDTPLTKRIDQIVVQPVAKPVVTPVTKPAKPDPASFVPSFQDSIRISGGNMGRGLTRSDIVPTTHLSVNKVADRLNTTGDLETAESVLEFLEELAIFL